MEDSEEESSMTQSSELQEEEEQNQRRNGNSCRVEDQHVLDFLDSTDDYLALMDSLSLILRQGWFELASARQSMGVSRVNGSLLDLKPRSASMLLRSEARDDDVEEREVHFTLHKWVSSIDGPGEGKLEEDKFSNSSQLRRRSSAFQASEKTALQNEAAVVADDRVQRERMKSLSVFGTLVSPKLRNSQLSFETALEKLVEIANARSTMLSSFQQIKDRLEGIDGLTI